MDKNQSPTPSAVTEKSQSCNHRVMWNVCDGEEEVYESVVSYRSLSPDHHSLKSVSSKSDLLKLRATSKSPCTSATDINIEKPVKDLTTPQGMPNSSSICLAMRYKPSLESIQDLATTKRARVIGCWHNLFDLIRHKKLENKASPTLGLRYKPSHESLKDRCSKDLITQRSRLTNSPKRNIDAALVKLETCFFPPYQTAIVREVAPKFANPTCMHDDSDSGCTGSKCRISLLKSSKSRKVSDGGSSPLAHSKSFISPIEVKNNDHNARRRTNSAAVSKVSTPKLNGNGNSGNPTNAMPTLRQRQQELHRIRVQIEKRRLELLDLKIIRERADALRHEILFHKDLQLKHNQIKSYEDNSSSQA